MNLNDLVYPWVSDQPMCVMVTRAGSPGSWFDFAAKAWPANPLTTFDPKRHSLAMTADPFFPSSQTAIIPEAAAKDPAAVVVVAAIDPKGKLPKPDHSWWLALAVVQSGRLVNRLGQMIAFP